MKLHLIHNGDSSVGDYGESFDIDCPFEYEHVENDRLVEFKKDMIKMYSEYVDYRLHGLYDYELKKLDI